MTVAAKICGLSTIEAVDAAVEGGADYIGLVFFEKSPRNVSLETAARLAAHAKSRAKVVALTVDADDNTLEGIVSAVAPDALQLHGRETSSRVAEIKTRFGVPIIKAVGITSAADMEAARQFSAADLMLYDAKPLPNSERPGGNGVAFDWRLLADAEPGSFMLSGGLTPDNVAEAIALTHAAAVDVSSGVESAPGVKDAQLIRRFLHAVKTAKA